MSKSPASTISNFQKVQKVNSFIYFLSHNFIFKHFFYEDLVENYVAKEGIVLTFNIINFLWSLLKKIFYFLVIASVVLLVGNYLFAPVFILLTILGGLWRDIIPFDSDDYYAVRLLKVNPATYSRYLIKRYLIWQFVYVSLAMILVSELLELPYWYCLVLTITYLTIHLSFQSLDMILVEGNNYLTSIKGFKNIAASILIIAAVILLVVFDVEVPVMIILIIAALFTLAGVVSYFYLKNWPYYQIVYNYNLNDLSTNAISQEVLITGIDNKTDLKEAGETNSNKTGYHYLYDVFFQRYKKQFRMPIYISCGICVLALIIIIIVNIFSLEDFSLLNYLTMLFWIMYLLCESFGKKFVETCFFQIDRYLINYGFYRSSKSIGENFKLRVLKIIQSLSIPTLLICLIVLVECIFEKADWQSYLVGILLPVILLGFYTIYFVSMYYLFQPYSFSGEVVNKIYSIANSAVYFLVFFLFDADIQFSLPVLALLAVILALVSVILYQITCRQAVKRFRVR